MKEYAKAISELAKAITGYFNPNAYESRVLRGLVGTGDKLSQNADAIYQMALKAGLKSRLPEMRRLKHFVRKWQADRLKLR